MLNSSTEHYYQCVQSTFKLESSIKIYFPPLPWVKVDGSHLQRMRGSGVSGVCVRVWVLLVGRGMASWAEIYWPTVQNRLGDHPASQSQCLHSGCHLHPDLLLPRCPAGPKKKKNCLSKCVCFFNNSAQWRKRIFYLRRPSRCVVHRGRRASLLVDKQLLPPLSPPSPLLHATI